MPLVKKKSGDLTDVDNYRAIALSNAETKVLETVILQKFTETAESDMYQFRFKKGHSIGICTSVVKRTVEYYLNRGSHVFSCFVDFSKAFDKVDYWKLFCQMIDDGNDVFLVKLLAFWYSNQSLCVAWQGCYSDQFLVGNGTKEGGVLSPFLFTRYVRPLITAVVQRRIGCNVGGLFVNIFAYADDMVLLAPSWHALQELIRTLEYWCIKLDLPSVL